MTTPNPGSTEALDLGCTCPVMDNRRGQGYRGIAGEFVYTFGCPIHCPGDDAKFSVTPSEGSFSHDGYMTIHLVPKSHESGDEDQAGAIE